MRVAEMEPTGTRRSRRVEKDGESESFGLFGSIRRVIGATLALLESRIELIALELREEKRRALSLLIRAVAVGFLGFLFFVAILGVVTFALWGSALAVLVGFSVFFVVVAAGSFFLARSKMKKIPFGETVAQLRKDRETISEELS